MEKLKHGIRRVVEGLITRKLQDQDLGPGNLAPLPIGMSNSLETYNANNVNMKKTCNYQVDMWFPPSTVLNASKCVVTWTFLHMAGIV
jgi:hypothetical protein